MYIQNKVSSMEVVQFRQESSRWNSFANWSQLGVVTLE